MIYKCAEGITDGSGAKLLKRTGELDDGAKVAEWVSESDIERIHGSVHGEFLDGGAEVVVVDYAGEVVLIVVADGDGRFVPRRFGFGSDADGHS